MSSVSAYQRALKREQLARKEAEKILEQKATELFDLNQELNAKNKILEQNFASKERELQDLFLNLVDGYVITNADGYILNINDSAKKILELEESNNVNLLQLVAPYEAERLAEHYKKIIQESRLSNFEMDIITLNKNRKTVQINASTIIDKEGKTVAMQGLVRDVTLFKKLERDRENLLNKLKLQNAELEEFAHVVSHDLKSPLRNIYALSTWIKDSLKDLSIPNIETHFSMIFLTLERMDKMISDIMEYSMSDKVAMDFGIVDLNVILEEISDQYSTKVNVKIEIAEDFPKIYGVKVKLFQVFQNLIDNAIKFNDKEQGLIKIYYKLIQNKQVLIHVRDNGPGVSEKQQRKIFKLFETSNKTKDSSGVGLSIVKKILDAHKSIIKINSVEEEYTEFYFNLKLAHEKRS